MGKTEKGIMRVIFAAVFCMAVLWTFCAGASAADSKKITVMVYMCGSNLESENGAATADITEMLKAKFDTEQVNVIVMTGGSSKWWGGFSAEETAVYEVSGNRPKEVWSDGLLNMGDPATLEEFLEYGYTQYPAERYSLILWDHGGGPMNGVCWDSLTNSDHLDMAELQEALDAGPFAEEKLSWIGFDACLMSSVETAYLMSPYAEYMVASQETEPGTGWSYSFLKGIEADADGAATGQRIVEAYFEATGGSTAGLTLSCIDLSKLTAVEECMDDFFGSLTVELNEETFASLSNLRQGTKGFGRAEESSQDYDLVDLMDLTEHYSEQDPAAAEALEQALQEAIVYNESNMENSNGLSVYHPYYNKDLYEQQWEQEYAAFYFSTGYTEYIRRFAGLWLGEALGDWTKQMVPDGGITEENEAVLQVQLTEDQLEQYASAQLYVLEKGVGENAYNLLYVTDQVTLQEDGILEAEYHGEAIYAVDEAGEMLSGTLSFRMMDGMYLIFANYINDETGDVLYTYFACQEQEDSDELEILFQYVYDEESGTYTNRLEVDLTSYEELIFPFSEYVPVWDGETLKAFEEWEKDSWVLATGEHDPSKAWHFQVFHESLDGSRRYATFQITDAQATTHSSELIEIVDDNRQDAALESDTIDTDDYTLQLQAEVNHAEQAKRVNLTFSVTNQTDQLQTYEINGPELILNESRSGSVGGGASLLDVEPGETVSKTIVLDSMDLTNLSVVESLDGTLTWYSSEDEERQEVSESFHFDLSADVSDIADRQEEDPFAVVQDGEILLELYDWKETEDGGFETVVHCVNQSGEFWRFDGDSVVIEGFALNIEAGYGYLAAGAGLDAYAEWKIENFFADEEDTSGMGLLFNTYGVTDYENILGHHGVKEYQEITLLGTLAESAEQEEICFKLDTPVRYEHAAEEEQEQLVLWARDGLSVKLEGMALADEKAILFVELSSNGDTDNGVAFLDPRVDGNYAKFYYQNWQEAMLDVSFQTGVTSHQYLIFDYARDEEESTEETEEQEEEQLLQFWVIPDRHSSGSAWEKISVQTQNEIDIWSSETIQVPLSELQIKVEEKTDTQPLFDAEVSLPEGAEALRQTLTFSPEEYGLEDVTSCKAVIFRMVQDDRTDGKTCVEPLTLIPLAEQDGVFSREYSGMVVMADWLDEPVVLPSQERNPGEGEIASTVSLNMLQLKDEYGFALIAPELSIQGTYTDGSLSCSAELINSDNDYSDWPVTYFSAEDGVLVINPLLEVSETGEETWEFTGELYDGSQKLDLTGETLTLAYAPLSDLGEEEYWIGYYVGYADDTSDQVGLHRYEP